MKSSLTTTIKLNNGIEIPQIGFGTALISEDESETVEIVLQALEAGYRHLDTAAVYKNETAVGKAIAKSKIPREELFVTTKLWNEDMRCDRMEQAFEESMEKLQLDYIDLYLIHWPVHNMYIKAWCTLEKIYHEKRARAVGVSNFSIRQLEDLRMCSELIPAVNQCEFHPRFMREELRRYCFERGIAFQAYKPLGQGIYVDNSILKEIAQNNNKSFAQVLLRWHLQHGVITIPKSVHKNYIYANADIFDFELTAQEMHTIDRMNIEVGTNDCTADCFNF